MTVIKKDIISDKLTQIGLSKEEARIYTLLIEIGSDKNKNTAFYIAKTLQIPRSTTYLNLDRLINLSIVSTYKINNVTHFLAEHPNKIGRDLERKQDILKNLIPNLEELKNNKTKDSSVKTYLGESGVKTVLDELFEKDEMLLNKEIITLSNIKLLKILPRGFPEKLDSLKKKFNVHTIMILTKPSQEESLSWLFKDDTHRETRYLPENYLFEGSLYLHGNKIAFFSLSDKEIYSVLIESPTIASMIRGFFLCLWDMMAI